MANAHIDNPTPGDRHERLIAREVVRVPGKAGWFVRADCDCGKTTFVPRARWGKAGSCGCVSAKVYAERKRAEREG